MKLIVLKGISNYLFLVFLASSKELVASKEK